MKLIARGAIVASIAASVSATPPPKMDSAVLAGGCFWGMEAVFEHVKGVHGVLSGYAGGSASDASYAKVSSERTRQAEAVRIDYDPREISYSDLLKIYFTVAHDPTQVNRQGPDIGPSYRSAIFPQDATQKALAERYIQILKQRGIAVATRIEAGRFYPAEDYHQDFAAKHPNNPYVVINDRPKLAALKKAYPQWWKG